MKTYLFIILFSLCGAYLNAQDWMMDFELAKKEATEKNLPIILVFQGSDWCAPCMKLEREIWSTDEFKAYAKNHFVMLQADFPKRKQNTLSEAQQTHNNNLAEQYNLNGYFPLIVILDSDGKVMGTTGYKKVKPSEYISLINAYLTEI